MHSPAHPPVRLRLRLCTCTRAHAQIRALQRHGGVKPLVRCNNLQEACAKAACDALEHVLPALAAGSNSAVVQIVLDRANALGLVDDGVLRVLQGSACVRSLHLIGNEVMNDWLQTGVLGTMRNLTELQLLSCFRLDDDTVSAVLATLPQLRLLSIDRCKKLGCPAIRDALPTLTSLRSFSVGGTRVGAESLALACDCLPALRELDVCSLSAFTDKIASAFFTSSTRGEGLVTLLASSTRIGNEGAAALGTQQRLSTLNLAFNPRVSEWSFLRSLTRLTDLDISLNYTVDDEAVAWVARSLPGLQYLNLAKTDISNAGAAQLATLRELRVLDLG